MRSDIQYLLKTICIGWIQKVWKENPLVYIRKCFRGRTTKTWKSISDILQDLVMRHLVSAPFSSKAAFFSNHLVILILLLVTTIEYFDDFLKLNCVQENKNKNKKNKTKQNKTKQNKNKNKTKTRKRKTWNVNILLPTDSKM